MNNIDFISEKWRTCRRTRNLARMHLAASIIPIIYVAMYAEAQRRDNDYKEFGAALAALMFNVFQLFRTIMGIVQLNAFVAWCKDAMECVRALSDKNERDYGNDRESRAGSSEGGVSSRAANSEQRSIRGTRTFCGFLNLKLFVTWCRRRMERMGEYMSRNTENRLHESTTDEEDIESSWYSYLDNTHHDEDEDIEEKIQVNNTVVDNELGGREVTVLPSWEKMWGGLKKGSLTPSKWLYTDRVMLNTVRWCGSYLCGMGEHWSHGKGTDRAHDVLLEIFFSSDLYRIRYYLQYVEWNIDMGNGGTELISINQLDAHGQAELTGEMCTAYGTGFDSYKVLDPENVE